MELGFRSDPAALLMQVTAGLKSSLVVFSRRRFQRRCKFPPKKKKKTRAVSDSRFETLKTKFVFLCLIWSSIENN